MEVSLVAVEQKLWSGTATIVSAQTTEGEIGIMAGHEPVLGQLVEAGTVSITTTDGEKIIAAVHGGFLSVTGKTVTVLAESADFADDIDVEAARSVVAENGDDLEAIAVAKGRIRAVERS
ncbi:F0F1 ATP synthase subunit epsilon [Rhodococcus fascians]|uniref:ATP synthase epsilon chain n=2 Tax=Nocardiaceae TaxID=85025 RepID=A0ABT4MQS6_9NOCA|nr:MULTISPECIES: F0F1 ATP synthase subunit epsilon [Rhodococcus]MBY4131467.1 F0F1 ATP synthase subunit epsilon [Rhodococcus fascians]MCZ4522076.1 F0F1 ATP synthase subunit epsilon [Rhodococcus ruber]MDV6264510.1 F0F1 ATP synthase subunit epsilon [Rhodococcus yunnanensis]QII08778.1 F0F1 ATP synthase subunit epsilon [Rhodococcus fascians A25f]